MLGKDVNKGLDLRGWPQHWHNKNAAPTKLTLAHTSYLLASGYLFLTTVCRVDTRSLAMLEERR